MALAGANIGKARPLDARQAFSFGRCSTALYGATDCPDRLSERLESVQADEVTAVAFVGSKTVVVSETVQAVIDLLRQCFRDKQFALVVVAGTASALDELRRVTGLVRGISATDGEVARQVFVTMAMLAAPIRWAKSREDRSDSRLAMKFLGRRSVSTAPRVRLKASA